MLLARSTRAVAFAVAWLLLPAASSGVVAAPMSTLSPQVIGALGGETTAVAVGPAAVYAAVGARIQVLSPGERPQPLGSSPLIEGRVYDLTLDGERLYVAAGPAGLQVFDVSRPDAIVALGRLSLPDRDARFVDLEILDGDRLAAIVEEAGGLLSRLLVIDVAQPEDMQLLADVALGGSAMGMARLGSRLVLNIGRSGLSLIEIDPAGAALTTLGRLDRPYERVAVAGDRLFAAFDFALHEIDWSEPAAPRVLGQPRDVSRKVDALWGAPGRLCAAGESEDGVALLWCYALLADEIPSWATSRALAAWQNLHRLQPFDGASVLGIEGEALYLAAGAEGLLRVDMAAGVEKPRKIGDFSTVATDLRLYGDLAFAAGTVSGLEIWDLSRQDDARRLWGQAVYSTRLELDGSWLYSLGAQKIEIRDVADPSAPVLLGQIPIAGLLDAMQVRAGMVYAMRQAALPNATERRLLVIDARDPSAPVLLDERALEADASQLRLHGDRLWYLSPGQSELVELDLRSSARPLEVSRHPVLRYASDLQVSEDRLVVVAGQRLQVYDAGAPGVLRPIGSPVSAASVTEIAVDGTLLAMTGSDFGIRFIDISGPDSIGEVAVWAPEGERIRSARALDLDGLRAIVAFGTTQSVHVLDLSGLRPDGVKRFYSAAWDLPTDIVTAADRSYLAAGWSGNWIIDSRDRRRPELSGMIDGEWLGSGADGLAPPQRRLHVTADGLLVVRPFTAYEVSNPLRPIERFRYVSEPSLALGTLTAMAPQTLIDGSLGFVGWHSVYRPQGPEGRSGRGPGMLDLVDLAGPVVPDRVARLELGDDPVDMLRLAGHLYVAGEAGFVVIDVRDPRAPTIVARQAGRYRSLAALDGRLWALGARALDVFDLGEPAVPRLVGSMALPAELPPGYEGRLAVTHYRLRTYGALPLGDAGLLLLDLREDLPRAIGLWRPGWPVAAVSLHGRHATVAFEYGGLLTLDLDLEPGAIAAAVYLPMVAYRSQPLRRK